MAVPCICDQSSSSGHDHPGDPSEYPIGADLKLGGHDRVATGLSGQPVRVGSGPHGGGPRQGGARSHRGSGQDAVAGARAHGIGFAGEDGLVDFQAVSLYDGGVGRHLIPAAQTQDVIEDDVGHVDLDDPPIAHGARSRRLKDGETVERALGAHLGERARGGVENHHEAEQGVGPPAHEEHEDERGRQDGVEDREDVGAQDRDHGTGGAHPIGIGAPLAHACGDLRG